MASGDVVVLDVVLARRRRLVTVAARTIALGLGVVSAVRSWERPEHRPGLALAVCAIYVALTALLAAVPKSRRGSFAPKLAHDLLDALSVGGVALFSGGLGSPVWLMLYPHVVATSFRGGLRYAIGMGLLDASVLAGLARVGQPDPHGLLHGMSLLFCASLAGIASTNLRLTRERLRETNAELSSKNAQLSDTLDAQRLGQAQQEAALHRLAESESRYRRLLERIQDGVLIIQDGQVVYANQVFAEIVSGDREALRGSSFLDLVWPDDRDDVASRYRHWEESQSTAGGFESRVLARSGEMRTVSLRAGSVEFEGRRAVIATIRDITRERQMEADVKAHAHRLSVLNDVGGAVNLSLTEEDILSAVAREARRLVPFDRVAFVLLDPTTAGVEVLCLGPDLTRTLPPIPRDQVGWAFDRPAAWCDRDPGPAPPLAHELLGDAGLRALASVPLLAKGRVLGALATGRHEQRGFTGLELSLLEPVARHIAVALDNARLLEAVRRRSQEFESLLEISRGILERRELSELLPQVTAAVNRIMGTHYCVLLLREGDSMRIGAQQGLEAEVLAAIERLRVGESLTGWVMREGRPLALDDMREDPRLRLSDMVDRFGYRSYLCMPLRRGSEVLGTLEVVTKDVHPFRPEEQALMSAFADQAALAIENARLFTEARANLAKVVETNRRLEGLDHMRKQYLRNVSHEFRTPLTVIKGYAEFLRDSEDTADGIRSVMRLVLESCDRVIDMVDTLIEVSRIEQEQAVETLRMEKVDLCDVVAQAQDALAPAMARKSLQVESSFPDGPLELEGDAGLLYQVVRKLLDNAVKYSSSAGRVLVRGFRDADEVCFDVEDFGIGIPSEHLGRIFEKFYMVDGGIARRSSGTGVGLYLVREIVRLHDGSVAVRSLPGRGSTFSVRLPRSRARGRARASA